MMLLKKVIKIYSTQHLNQAGKGIPKFLRADGPEPAY
jgi:hypothetical protein